MTKYFAKSTKGFYDSEINASIPQDAVSLTDQQYNLLMAAQENGMIIAVGEDGMPIAVNVPAPTKEEIVAANKAKASQLLTASDWATKSAIANPEQSTPYLTNQQAFFGYQNQLRAIAVNPPTLPVTEWPVEPKALWSN